MMIIGSLGMFVWYTGAFALIPLGTAAMLTFFSFRVQQRLSPYLRELRLLRGGIFQVMIESLEGIRTIRSHQSEHYVERRFALKLDEAQVKTMYVAHQIGALGGQTEFFTKCLITLCLSGDAWLYSRGKLTLDKAFIYPFFAGIFYDSVSGFTDKIYHWNQFFNEAGRVADLIYREGASDRAVRDLGSSYRMSQQVNSIELHGLSLGYPGKTLISPFDFTLKRGDLWAVMGPSGCGKSTFLEVLAGLRAAQSVEAKILTQNGQRLPLFIQARRSSPSRGDLRVCRTTPLSL